MKKMKLIFMRMKQFDSCYNECQIGFISFMQNRIIIHDFKWTWTCLFHV